MLDEQLSRFYSSLVRPEARHFKDYPSLARRYADSDITARIRFYAGKERGLILDPDPMLRFHSGVPMAPGCAQADFASTSSTSAE